jgi:hypothetical protein
MEGHVPPLQLGWQREDRSGAVLLKGEYVRFSRPAGRDRINYIHRYLNLQGRFDLGLFVSAYDPLQAGAAGCKIDQLGYAGFQGTRSRHEENDEKQIWNDEPEVDVRNVELSIYQES